MFESYIQTITDNINNIRSHIEKQDNIIAEAMFFKQCCIDRLLAEIYSIETFPWVYKEKFYHAIHAYINRKENPLPKTKEERKEKYGYDPKTCYDIAIDNLKQIYPTVNAITNVIFCGWHTIGIRLIFTLSDVNDTYFIEIPLVKNITHTDIAAPECNYIDYNIGKFKIGTSSLSSYEVIWSGYNLDDAKNVINVARENT